MIRATIATILVALFIKSMKKGDALMMAMFFAQRVILGKTKFDEVPAALKRSVADLLLESGPGIADLVPEEYR